ncbi:MAG: peptidoglycan-binding domain-containing protein [Terracidiphilus sp.]|nr:peptidoglycan-binding domain-containing protein [Terracidiphilus sp.]
MALSTALIAIPAIASRVHQAPTSGHHRSSGSASHKSSSKSGAKVTRTRAVTRSRGQQAIDSERVSQIQQALIREHYMTGDATGSWDSATIAAMQKFQADQGWQTKLMPDSRAIKKLGLGPDYSNAINASGSSFANPARRGTTTAEQSAAFAEAAGVHQ